MKPVTAQQEDFRSWLDLAREVEHLFGPMAGESSFHDALLQAIQESSAFCIRAGKTASHLALAGGIVISRETNEIVWLAVSEKSRRKGCGRTLLEFALPHLDMHRHMYVQTFDETVRLGSAARNLYRSFGFEDYRHAGLNPAGIPTVIMRLHAPPLEKS